VSRQEKNKLKPIDDMCTADFDARDLELQKPDVFRSSFNRFEPINLSQAWSLWIMGGRNDARFGLNPATGWLITLILIASLALVAVQQVSPGFP